MNRRSFLSGLIALPVAAQLGRVNRVYSFPTDIVIADHREILMMWGTASGWKSHEDIIKPLPRSVVRACGPRFRENLKDRTPFSSVELAYFLSLEAMQGMIAGMEEGRLISG